MNIHTGKLLNLHDNLNQSIKLILLTPKGERLLNRSSGSNMMSYLGQPINNVLMQIRAEVVSSLQGNDSRIFVDRVVIKNNDEAALKLSVQYNDGGSTDVSIT